MADTPKDFLDAERRHNNAVMGVGPESERALLPIAQDYISTAKRSLSAAIRELESTHVFADRAGLPCDIQSDLRSLTDQARAIRSQMEHL